MIPYDDLVAALAAWRTRQGLPVARLAGAPAPAAEAVAPAAPPPARPTPAARPAAPAPRPTPAARPAAVVVEHTHEDSLDVDEAALLEESYDRDFAVSFGNAGESTSVGVPPPPRMSDDDEPPAPPPPPRRGGGGSSW